MLLRITQVVLLAGVFWGVESEWRWVYLAGVFLQDLVEIHIFLVFIGLVFALFCGLFFLLDRFAGGLFGDAGFPVDFLFILFAGHCGGGLWWDD